MGKLADYEQAIVDRYFRGFNAMERIAAGEVSGVRLTGANLHDLKSAVDWACALHALYCAAHLHKEEDGDPLTRDLFLLVELQRELRKALSC
jgi:hypothetical protein